MAVVNPVEMLVAVVCLHLDMNGLIGPFRVTGFGRFHVSNAVI